MHNPVEADSSMRETFPVSGIFSCQETHSPEIMPAVQSVNYLADLVACM